MKNSSSSTTRRAEDIQGVECQVCEKEIFRIFTRKIVIAPGITAKIKCCPGCARVIDAEKETKNEQHYKTRAEQQEVSFQWANNLHGKKVIVFWQDGVPYINFNKRDPWEKPKPIKQAQGTAYRITNCSGGWGQVKVILDPEENKRVSMACHETMYCSTVKRDMYFVSDSFVCDNANCKEQVPVMDRQRWGGLSLDLMEDGNYYTLVTWGARETIKPFNEVEQMR